MPDSNIYKAEDTNNLLTIFIIKLCINFKMSGLYRYCDEDIMATVNMSFRHN